MSTAAGRSGVRVEIGAGSTNIETGVPVLDHLLERLAEAGGFQLVLHVEPRSAEAEIEAAGIALGEAFADPLRTGNASGTGSAFMVSDEALAHVVLEASGRPLVVSNVDLSDARVAGLATDVVARFLQCVAEGAGLTAHVRLVNGSDTQHVLDAIFKALGLALARAIAEKS